MQFYSDNKRRYRPTIKLISQTIQQNQKNAKNKKNKT